MLHTYPEHHVLARTDDGMFQYMFAFIWLEFQEVMPVTVCVGVCTHCIVWVLDVCEMDLVHLYYNCIAKDS